MTTAPQITNVKAEVLSASGTSTHGPVSTLAPKQEPVVQSSETLATMSSLEKLRLDLDKLVRLGKIEKEVIIQGFKIKMSTISASENTRVLEATSGIENIDTKLSYMRLEILGRAIETINDIPFEMLYEGDNKENKVFKKIAILNSWQQVVVNELWAKYNEMIEQSEKLTKDTEGTALKN